MPGRISICSRPISRKNGHSRSTSSQATNSVPSEVPGASGFAAKATAKWPMNISAAEQRLPQVLLDRLLAEPDAQQRAIEILALDGRARRLAVHHEQRLVAGPVERDDHAGLRLLQLRHDGAEDRKSV